MTIYSLHVWRLDDEDFDDEERQASYQSYRLVEGPEGYTEESFQQLVNECTEIAFKRWNPKEGDEEDDAPWPGRNYEWSTEKLLLEELSQKGFRAIEFIQASVDLTPMYP